jgi:hypothetical protein
MTSSYWNFLTIIAVFLVILNSILTILSMFTNKLFSFDSTYVILFFLTYGIYAILKKLEQIETNQKV